MKLRILLLRHYPLLEGHSMRAFADQIATGLRSRGYAVEELTAPVVLGGLLPPSISIVKWLGYADQFLIFPPWLWIKARLLPSGTLCVLTDQALGPWLPLLRCLPTVVHCHDLLALEASLGLQPFHSSGWSGYLYQRFILWGFRQGRSFLSVSAATQAALEPYLFKRPYFSAVLHHPLPPRFRLLPEEQASAEVQNALPQLQDLPFLLQIGNAWYKNRLGAMEIWEQLLLLGVSIDLVLLGAADRSFHAWQHQRPHLKHSMHVLDCPCDELVVALYNRASALLYPSHAEGFGLPILEALACGCPVITTNRLPMIEVGGEAVTTIPPMPPPPEPWEVWAQQAAMQLFQVLSRSPTERLQIQQLGFAQANRFQPGQWLDHLESFYQHAVAKSPHY